jgi:hypothetical protein
MICWDRVGDHLVLGLFDKSEVDRLRGYLVELREVLDARFAEYTTDCPPGKQLGVAYPSAETGDRRLRAIMRRRVGEVGPWREPEVFRPLHKAITRVLATLPDKGGLVQLHSIDCAGAWSRALTDLRVAMSASAREAEPVLASRTRFTTRWLKSVVRTLNATAAKEVEPVPQHLVDSINQVRTYWN